MIDPAAFDLKIIYTWILARQNKRFCVVCPDPGAFMKKTEKSLPLIKAAGGLVVNEKDAYLFIYRHDKWDLPKGKIEKNERIKVAAVREVEEECGIKVGRLGVLLTKTWHAYIFKGEVVLKKTYWYKMECRGQDKLKPQKEEGITAVKWFKRTETTPILDNTFPLIKNVMKKAGLVKDKPKPLSV